MPTVRAARRRTSVMHGRCWMRAPRGRIGRRIVCRRRAATCGASAWVPARIAALDLSPALTTELAPLFAVYASLNEQIAAADRRIATVAASDPVVARLATAPGVGPVTA